MTGKRDYPYFNIKIKNNINNHIINTVKLTPLN